MTPTFETSSEIQSPRDKLLAAFVQADGKSKSRENIELPHIGPGKKTAEASWVDVYVNQAGEFESVGDVLLSESSSQTAGKFPVKMLVSVEKLPEGESGVEVFHAIGAEKLGADAAFKFFDMAASLSNPTV